MTRRPTRLAGVAALVLAVAVPAGRAQQTTPQRAAGTVKAGVTAVLVDVVVRDKRGQPIRDLQQSDFQVLEDGIPQTIGSFTRMFDGAVMAMPRPDAPSAPRPAGAVGSPLPVSAGPAVTALVFDRLNPEARRLAVRAAHDYLGSSEQASDYIGV